MFSILVADWFATLNFVGGCAFGIWGWNRYGQKIKNIWKNLSK